MDDLIGPLIAICVVIAIAAFIIQLAIAALTFVYICLVWLSVELFAKGDWVIGSLPGVSPAASWGIVAGVVGFLIYFGMCEAPRLNRIGVRPFCVLLAIGAVTFSSMARDMPWVRDFRLWTELFADADKAVGALFSGALDRTPAADSVAGLTVPPAPSLYQPYPTLIDMPMRDAIGAVAERQTQRIVDVPAQNEERAKEQERLRLARDQAERERERFQETNRQQVEREKQAQLLKDAVMRRERERSTLANVLKSEAADLVRRQQAAQRQLAESQALARQRLAEKNRSRSRDYLYILGQRIYDGAVDGQKEMDQLLAEQEKDRRELLSSQDQESRNLQRAHENRMAALVAGHNSGADVKDVTAAPPTFIKTRAYLGVTLSDLDAHARDASGYRSGPGVFVDSVAPGGPADKAGIRPRDVVREINGAECATLAELRAMMATLAAGETAKVTVWRDRRMQQHTVVLAGSSGN